MLLVKVPSNLGSLNKNLGTEMAPDAIVERLKENILNEREMLPRFSVEEIQIEKGNILTTQEDIYKRAKTLLFNTPCFLGGDHSITYSLLKAFSEHFENPGAIIFDAHPDLMDGFTNPTHDNYLRMVLDDKIIRPENIILTGLRNMHTTELTALKDFGLKHFSMREISQESVHEICDSIMSVAKNFGALYVSIDIDVVDPAFAPGTAYLEPGGLSSRELLHCLHRLKNLKNLKAFDVVEINPEKDTNDLTLNLGAKIIQELY